MLCLDWEKGREKKRKKVGNLSKHFVIRFLFGEGFKWLVKKDDVAGFYWLAYNQFFFIGNQKTINNEKKWKVQVVHDDEQQENKEQTTQQKKKSRN